ncbi:hypothetical protein AB4Y90_16700 [Chryseobacterium sp. 2TAF14]|uniref:hypothetical protein n=1 Tax=Chryseobacterium sp. 2TAF14 TaxID=3233007 RepID=UPI003F912786
MLKEGIKLNHFLYSLKNYKKILEDQPFHNFICWLSRRGLQIIRVDNLIDKNNLSQIFQTKFTIKNSMEETGRIIIYWENSIPKREIKKYEKRYGNSFSYNERNLYVDSVIKKIIILK